VTAVNAIKAFCPLEFTAVMARRLTGADPQPSSNNTSESRQESQEKWEGFGKVIGRATPT